MSFLADLPNASVARLCEDGIAFDHYRALARAERAAARRTVLASALRGLSRLARGGG